VYALRVKHIFLGQSSRSFYFFDANTESSAKCSVRTSLTEQPNRKVVGSKPQLFLSKHFQNQITSAFWVELYRLLSFSIVWSIENIFQAATTPQCVQVIVL